MSAGTSNPAPRGDTDTLSSRPEADATGRSEDSQTLSSRPEAAGRSGETPVFRTSDPPPGDPQIDAQHIRDLVATWARGSETGDLEAIKSLMDDDILFLTAGNEPFGRDVFIQHF